MRGPKQRFIGYCLALLLPLATSLSLTGAMKAGAEDMEGNLLMFPITDSEELKAEFEMGNLLLFTGGDGEQEDNGVIDDSVLTEEDDTGGDDEAVTDEAGTASGVARITGSSVMLRKEANADSEAVAELSEGVTVTITGREGKWLQVSFGILQGYVLGDYVFEVTEEGLNGTILRDGVNMRESGSLEAAVVKQLSAGAGVQVTDYVNGWYKVNSAEKTGYVRNDCILVSGTFTGEAATRLLKSGMSGEAVKKAQTELKRRGFFLGEATGDFGPKTTQAVKDFQKAAKLKADGVLGEQTLEILYGNNNIKVTIATASQIKGRVQMTEWSRVNNIIPRGKTFKIIDVRTGVTWTEQRRGGYLHIDSEPLTPADTLKLKSVYGGKWTWNRRPVWVIYGNYVFAASMNGMPHGGEAIGSSNNFNGHHCVHFYKSRTHCSNSLDSRHQACVLEAYKAGK